MKVYKILGVSFMVLSIAAMIMSAVFVIFGFIFGETETIAMLNVAESILFMVISFEYDKLYMRTKKTEEKETENGEDAE